MRQASGEQAFGAALFAGALVPRLWVALRWAGEPVWDGHYYDFGARRIAAGLGYSDDVNVAGHLVWHPWCHYPVGYSAALGALYRAFGPDLRVAAVANAVTGALLAVVSWRLAREAMSSLRARIAGGLVALHPGLVLYGALVMTEPLSALLTLTGFWVAVRGRGRGLGGFAAGAAILGLAALVRPQALLCVPFLALVPARAPAWAAKLGRAWRLALVPLACAAALAPVLPWTARNCARMDGCALVSTNAGWNLAIGAFPRATGRFETLRASDGCREVTGQVQQDRCWLNYGLSEIREHPGRWLALVPKKLGFTFDHESFPVEYLHEARPSAWPEPRRSEARRALTSFHRALLATAALGLFAWARDRRGRVVQVVVAAAVLGLIAMAARADVPSYWPIAVACALVPFLPLPGSPPRPAALLLPVSLLATTVLAHAVFFGEDRYHVAATPVLCILAAGALRREGAHT